MVIRRDNKEVKTVRFDESIPSEAVVFEPTKPVAGPGLWWTKAEGPEVIEAVVDTLLDDGPGVGTIVIAGLERYPVGWAEWPKWLARWARRDGLEVFVRTGGLNPRRRRQLIRRTRRLEALRHTANPVIRLTKTIEHWFLGRTA